jgi:hypothetical protein
VWGVNNTPDAFLIYGVNWGVHFVFGDTTVDMYSTLLGDRNNVLSQATIKEAGFEHGVPKKVDSGTFTQSGETIKLIFPGNSVNGTVRANVLTLFNSQGGITMTFAKVKSLNGLEPVQ